MKLIFCEKPSMGRDIAKVLNITETKSGYIEGNGYCVTWAAGHFVGLATPEEYGFTSWSKSSLPLMPESFKLSIVKERNKSGKMVVSEFVAKQFKVIEKLFKKCTEIIVATDAGREGELIFRNIYEYTGCKKPFKRLWTASLTDSAIKKAFAELKNGNEFDNLFFSARARSQADWLVGINSTQSLSIALNAPKGTSVSAGRVQTPTLALICKRYLENKNFIKSPFWKIQIKLNKEQHIFFATAAAVFTDQAKANSLFSALKSNDEKIGEIKSVDKKETKDNTPLLHDLASLQKKANVQLNFSMEHTQSIAQSLYEKKLITYPRTGSKYIPQDVFKNIPTLLEDILSDKLFIKFRNSYPLNNLSKNSVNDTKVTDHHALLTTEVTPTDGELSKDELAIYSLIRVRMLEAFAEYCTKDVTTVTVLYGIEFIAKGIVIKQQGWRRFDNAVEDEEPTEETQALPQLNTGELLPIIDTQLVEGFTKPKPLYTDATILSAMENCGKDVENDDAKKGLSLGIGTPATRAQIIKLLYTRNYITKDGKKLLPTQHGLAVYNKIKDFPFANVELTGKWEIALAAIADGKFEESKFIASIKSYTSDTVKDIFKLANN